MTEEEVVCKFADMVYRIAMIRMKHPCEVDDVFQDVFLKYLKSGRNIQDEEHLKAWLIRVTINCCNSAQTNLWKKRTVPMGGQEEAVWEFPDNDDGIIKAVSELPEKERDVIHLFYYEEYSIREISRILNSTEGAVKTRLSRARDRLRKKLEKSC